MASNMLSPGVQVTEMDFSDYVEEASTCIIGIVGGARKGPLEPTLITTKAQFLKTFGEPTLKDYGAYSALAVLTNCDKIYYCRAIKEASKAKAGGDRDLLHWESLGEDILYNNIIIDMKGTETSMDIKVTLGEKEESYTGLTRTTIESAINGVSQLVTVDVNPDDGASYQVKKQQLKDGAKGAQYAKSPDSDLIEFTTLTPDSTNNGAKVVISEPDHLDLLTYTLYTKDGDIVEQFASLTTNPKDDRFIEKYINQNSYYVECNYDESKVDEKISGTYTLDGGTDGITGLSAKCIIEAIDKFSNEEEIDVDILLTPGWSEISVVKYGMSLAETRKDLIYLIDPPFGMNAQQVVNWSNCTGGYQEPVNYGALDSSFAALYWPWVQIYDTYTETNIWLPPSGYVASQIAYSDSVSEPWFAPAGLNRGKLASPVVGIEYSPTKGERDILYGNRNIVNPLVNYKGKGLVIWGQKTAQRRPTALDRVNVRRLTNYLKKIIAASTAYFVFEPNDKYSWEKWCNMVRPKLAAIKAKRGVYDFRVVMDETTVLEDDINNNRMPGIIMYKPTKTAEFIPLQFQILSYGAMFGDENQ